MSKSNERVVGTFNGWGVLLGLLLMAVLCFFIIFTSIERGVDGPRFASGWSPMTAQLTAGILLSLLWLFLPFGFFTLQPNQSAVLMLFGAYRGTAKETGLRWANPLLTKKKVSLRAHNLNGEKLKVNDKIGNPIEIAVVVVWRVQDTAQACFDVESYSEYVTVQSESAVRHLASKFAYDTTEGETMSLRANVDEVSRDLQAELGERFLKAGVVVDEARLAHLAYAPEIAGAMLRRQQAEAIVAARKRIVDGAIGMVELALAKLEENDTVKLDEERKATMVSNLLVVLCSEKDVSPVINTGSLYT